MIKKGLFITSCAHKKLLLPTDETVHDQLKKRAARSIQKR